MIKTTTLAYILIGLGIWGVISFTINDFNQQGFIIAGLSTLLISKFETGK